VDGRVPREEEKRREGVEGGEAKRDLRFEGGREERNEEGGGSGENGRGHRKRRNR